MVGTWTFKITFLEKKKKSCNHDYNFTKKKKKEKERVHTRCLPLTPHKERGIKSQRLPFSVKEGGEKRGGEEHYTLHDPDQSKREGEKGVGFSLFGPTPGKGEREKMPSLLLDSMATEGGGRGQAPPTWAFGEEKGKKRRD